jgi:hypothetical protein
MHGFLHLTNSNWHHRIKVKDTASHAYTGKEGRWRYSSKPFTTSVLERGTSIIECVIINFKVKRQTRYVLHVSADFSAWVHK